MVRKKNREKHFPHANGVHTKLFLCKFFLEWKASLWEQKKKRAVERHACLCFWRGRSKRKLYDDFQAPQQPGNFHHPLRRADTTRAELIKFYYHILLKVFMYIYFFPLVLVPDLRPNYGLHGQAQGGQSNVSCWTPRWWSNKEILSVD